MRCASAVDMHPGIVVGMLQHARITPFRNLSGFKVNFQSSDMATRGWPTWRTATFSFVRSHHPVPCFTSEGCTTSRIPGQPGARCYNYSTIINVALQTPHFTLFQLALRMICAGGDRPAGKPAHQAAGRPVARALALTRPCVGRSPSAWGLISWSIPRRPPLMSAGMTQRPRGAPNNVW